MFLRNKDLLQQYAIDHPQSQESLVDFGVVPSDREDRQDWCVEVVRIVSPLMGHGYVWLPAQLDPQSGLCPLYTVQLDRRDFEGLRPVELPYFQQVVNQLCQLGQHTILREQDRVLEIHVLGDGQSLSEILNSIPS